MGGQIFTKVRARLTKPHPRVIGYTSECAASCAGAALLQCILLPPPGVDIFCDAIDMLLEERGDLLRGVSITFLAKLKQIDGVRGRVWLDRRVSLWIDRGVVVQLLADRNSMECRYYLR